MKLRLRLADIMLKLGTILDRFALMVMRPDDLIAFTQRHYQRREVIDAWSGPNKVGEGFHPGEKALLAALSPRAGRALVLAAGGGREAIALAKKGYAVTAVDFVPEMIARLKDNAKSSGVEIDARVANFITEDFSTQSYEIVWVGGGSYSSIPTRARRIEFLRRIRQSLATEGQFLCQMVYYPQEHKESTLDRLAKRFASLTRGNVGHEKGDMLSGKSEFVHCFGSKREILKEIRESGFSVVLLVPDSEAPFISAVLVNKSRILAMQRRK